MVHSWRAVAASCCAVGCLLITPETQASEPRVLTLSMPAALIRANAASPEVVRAHYAEREAAARRVGAGLIIPQNPKLSIDARPLLRGPIRDMGYGATLEFVVDAGGAPRARVHEAERALDVAHADLAAFRVQARVRTLQGYVTSQIAALRIAEADAALVVARRVLDASERRVRAGASSDLESSSATLQVAELEADRVSLERERDRARMDLRDALDLNSDVQLELTTALTEPPSLGEVSGLAERALRSHPELRALRARVDLWRATEARLEAEVFPRLGFYAGLDSAPLSPTFGVLGVSVELTVAQRNLGARAQSARARESAQAELGLEAPSLSRTVMQAASAYEASRRELERLSSRAIPAAERTLALAEAGYEAGRFDVFRLLSAARDSLRVRASRVNAIEAAWLFRIELERAVGGEVKS